VLLLRCLQFAEQDLCVTAVVPAPHLCCTEAYGDWSVRAACRQNPHFPTIEARHTDQRLDLTAATAAAAAAATAAAAACCCCSPVQHELG
jgi:hypothetical protein